MLKATVTGSVWATRRVEGIPRGAFLEVEADDGAQLVAFDVLGSGLGESVLVATGSVASNWFALEHPPIDALIIGSLDGGAEAQEAGQSATQSTTGSPQRHTRRKET